MSAARIVAGLQKKMRVSGVGLARLAEGIGVSASTVKRIFRHPEDLTLGRLDEICAFLKTTSAELLELTPPNTLNELTPTQDEVLASDPLLLEMFYGVMSVPNVKDLAAYSQKTPAEIQSAARELESLNLVERGNGDSLRTKLDYSIAWPKGGQLATKVFPKILGDFASGGFAGDLEFSHFKGMLISPESASILTRKAMALAAEADELCRIDLRFAAGKVIPWALHCAGKPFVPHFFGSSASYPSQHRLRMRRHPAK